ncbi:MULTISPECIES: DUF402 domain-containing protein [unclassified Paenibacillus]|uniref:DUF402 domain-containing protein n=1 Tax=unclassified Paenibacillus TaxID=185978 RepID=UPI001C115A1C|nr:MULTISPECIES: DUF402 domain-containing protein [unclassified Paenibacillus]MBU5443130.1 DUF402 domain-containing protein [Paenibacillus sp. MSJ-34]CAH0121142.1 hypothetical protein PAE9249_03668 [Paenibacillus sp. CECT 9249]
MKRKFSDRANWRRIISKQFISHYMEQPEFTGYVTLYTIERLKEPLWKEYDGQTLCLADEGYSWLQYFPKGEHFIVTAMFDDRQRIIQWYIDICKSQGVTEQGVPWFDDLFLDIVVLPSGTVILMDEDELDEALIQGEISQEDYELATETAQHLLRQISAHVFPYFVMSQRHRSHEFGSDRGPEHR